MKKNVIEHLRRFSSVPGKEKTWVSELSDDRLFDLYLKIRNGESARGIACHVQTVWKVCRKSSVHSVSQGILKFKQRISHLLLFPSPDTDEASTSVFSPMREEDSPLETMENITRQYEARIKGMIAEEEKTGVKYPFISRDLQALAGLRKAILKQKEWEATHEEPLDRRRYQKMAQRIDRRFNNLMESLGTEGQSRMIEGADRFLQLVEERAITMHEKEDGTYDLIKD